MVCETVNSCEESRYNFQRKLRNVDEGINHIKPEKTRLSITVSKQQAVFQMLGAKFTLQARIVHDTI